MSLDPLDRAVALWEDEGAPLVSGWDESAIRSVFNGLGFPLSADVLRLYQRIGGFEDVHSDGFWLWTPDRIADRRSDLPDWFRKEGFLCFADLLLDSHYYALQWVNDTRSAVWFDWGSGPTPLNRSPAAWTSCWRK